MSAKTNHLRHIIEDRLAQLGARMQDIETELDKPKSKDLGDQAIDLEDDEVLETLGIAASQEVRELRSALDRMAAGTFGICAECESEISVERLELVPFTRLCRECANRAAT
jgi:RNA polymerase-binding transcription factor DksA